jgi:hypothetical protein
LPGSIKPGHFNGHKFLLFIYRLTIPGTSIFVFKAKKKLPNQKIAGWLKRFFKTACRAESTMFLRLPEIIKSLSKWSFFLIIK